MPDNFQQTVNLREKASRLDKSRREKKAEQIEHLYNDEDNSRKNWQKFDKAKEKKVNESFVKRVVFFLFILIVGSVLYWLLFWQKDEQAELINNKSEWYAVKLVNEEVYYGQVADATADPIVLHNVYYNYDQAIGGEEAKETGNLRLVKRGKETHGPSGTMNVVRTQVLYMEPLKEDSKVLKAILEYEQ